MRFLCYWSCRGMVCIIIRPCRAAPVASTAAAVESATYGIQSATIRSFRTMSANMAKIMWVAEAPPEILIQELYVCILYTIHSKQKGNDCDALDADLHSWWTHFRTQSQPFRMYLHSYTMCGISIDRKLVEQSFHLSRFTKNIQTIRIIN